MDSGAHNGIPDTLHSQMKVWVKQSWKIATVSTGANRQKDGSMTDKLDQQVKSWATARSGMARGGKLNPRWVETLMGLPVGWTMPSCQSPATIELTNSDSSVTELCQPPPL